MSVTTGKTRYWIDILDREEKCWVGLDGWPCYFHESHVGSSLIELLRRLPSPENLSEEQLILKATFLSKMADIGKEQDQTCNRPASQKASESELTKLHDLCEKLSTHLESLHEPALTALENEGFLIQNFSEYVWQIQEGAKIAFGSVEGQSSRGRPKQEEAAIISLSAASMYQEVTGKRATFTTDPASGEISGKWPEFLEAVFSTLSIRASVASQVRAVSEKIPPVASI